MKEQRSAEHVDAQETETSGSVEISLFSTLVVVGACVWGLLLSAIPLPILFLGVSLGRMESYAVFMAVSFLLTLLYWRAGPGLDGGRYSDLTSSCFVGAFVTTLLYLAAFCFVIAAPITTFLGVIAVAACAFTVIECFRIMKGHDPVVFRGRPCIEWHPMVIFGIAGYMAMFTAIGLIPCDVAPEEFGEVAPTIALESNWAGSSPEERLGMLRGVVAQMEDDNRIGKSRVKVEAGAFGLLHSKDVYIGQDGSTIFVNVGLLADSQSGRRLADAVEESAKPLTDCW